MEQTGEFVEAEAVERAPAKEKVKVKVDVSRSGRILFGILLFCLFSVLLDSTGIAREEATRPLHQALPALVGLIVFGGLFIGKF